MTSMYRDDRCAVCGESLPPDHFYCRLHGAEVDDRLHEIGELLGHLTEDLPRLAKLLGEIAPETWDWLAEQAGEEDVWPPVPPVELRVHADEVDVDVDTEPGQVRIHLAADLHHLLTALAEGLRAADAARVAAGCAKASGANATH